MTETFMNIAQQIADAGGRLYLVGGAVRDKILGLENHDLDFCVTGLSTKEFAFIGFLSGTNSEKKNKLKELEYETKTLIFYEAPHRLESTLSLMEEVFGSNRKIVVCKELTKIHESFYRATLSTIREQIVHQRVFNG